MGLWQHTQATGSALGDTGPPRPARPPPIFPSSWPGVPRLQSRCVVPTCPRRLLTEGGDGSSGLRVPVSPAGPAPSGSAAGTSLHLFPLRGPWDSRGLSTRRHQGKPGSPADFLIKATTVSNSLCCSSLAQGVPTPPSHRPCSRCAPAGLVPARGWALLPPAAAGVGPGPGGQQVRARGRHPAPHLSSAGRLAARVSPRWEGTRSLGPQKVRGRDRAEQPPPETSSNPGPARLAEPGLLPRRGNALCSAVPAKGGPGSF